MKIIFHEDFYQVYTTDPAAAQGRMEAIVAAVDDVAEFVTARPADVETVAAIHTREHVARVQRSGPYALAVLAAGAAIQAADIALNEPAFALVRPPGHHASSDSAWGFCYFNNMAIAVDALKRKGAIQTAYVLDIDLHFGDGTVNILGQKDYVSVYNVQAHDRQAYLDEIAGEMTGCAADIIGISAGFDNHRDDWGGLLLTEDYTEIGYMVRKAARGCQGACFGVLEGGYNHSVLGANVRALLQGLSAV